MSRQAYYRQCKAEAMRHERDRQIVEQVRQIRCRQPRIGTRKLHQLLKAPLSEQGIQLGRDALFAVLKRAHLLVAPQRAFHKTTDSFHRFYKHPNLVMPGQASRLDGCEQLWVADITYLPTVEKCVYVSLVTDAYSRKIVGYHVHDSLQTEEVAIALKMALAKRQGKGPLIHHSDRGVQYCSAYYQAIHQANGITCSMTDGYDCYQNALAERINGILKTEFLLYRPHNLQQARQMVAQSIAIYNQERPHLALQYKTPDAVHRASLEK
jgi:transposase InsO family protein